MNETIVVEQVAHANIAIMILIGAIALFVALIYIVFMLIIYCRIFSKAGYSWAMGLLMLVPIVNLIMLILLAFSDWPIYKEFRRDKELSMSPTLHNPQ